MCLESFKRSLEDCFFKALELFATDQQLDVIYGILPQSTHLKSAAFEDLVSTYTELPRKKYCDNEVCDKKVFDAEVEELVEKMNHYKKPVIVLTFKD